MPKEGFIKDYRQELDSNIWIMPPLYHRVWQWFKYEVNHTDNEIPMKDGTTFLVKRGQRLTSYRNIAKSVGWYEGLQWKEPNPKTIKTICDWLEKNNMIIQEHGKGNRQFTLITLVNWGVYQSKKDEGVTGDKQESNTKETQKKQVADINKNEKNDNKYIIIYEAYLTADITQHKSLTEVMKKSIDKVLKKYSIDDVLLSIKRYSEMYHDKTYEWCNYKWSLNELLTREKGIGYFLDDGDKWINYCEFKNKNKKPSINSNNNSFDFSYFDK